MGKSFTQYGHFTTVSRGTVAPVFPTNMTANSATIRADVLSTGGEDVQITFYWGDNNASNQSANWDNNQTLSKLAYNFLKDKKISISSSNINLIVNKCSGDRETLLNELQKIEYFTKNGKKIDSNNISKLINLIEDHSISELIDNCLAKNEKKIINILNENNFSNEDCIIITRTFIAKAKKLLALSKTFEINKNMDLTISSAKPPIFWKEKEITKQQIQKWKPKNIKNLIYALSETELQIKKNINNSINIITDFILLQSSSATSN